MKTRRMTRMMAVSLDISDEVNSGEERLTDLRMASSSSAVFPSASSSSSSPSSSFFPSSSLVTSASIELGGSSSEEEQFLTTGLSYSIESGTQIYGSSLISSVGKNVSGSLLQSVPGLLSSPSMKNSSLSSMLNISTIVSESHLPREPFFSLLQMATSTSTDFDLLNTTNITTDCNCSSLETAAQCETPDFVKCMMGEVRDPLSLVIPLTLIYSLILVCGFIGNICTCLVIVKNKYMHTTVNYYLFSLAVSDLLLLILGLPQELWGLWSKYPYIFGESFCILRALTSETSTNASILTITAFTVERYLAICHPLKAHTMSQLPRAIKVILVIWAMAGASAVPIATQLGIVYVVYPQTNETLSETAHCTLKNPLPHAFEISTICFFVLPMCIISVLYVLIGLRLRQSSSMSRKEESAKKQGESLINHHHHHHHHSQLQHQHPQQQSQQKQKHTSQQETQFHPHNLSQVSQHHHQEAFPKCGSAHYKQHLASRRAVIKMLVAIVVSFFICWSPFHLQRVMTSSPTFGFGADFYYVLTYISGVTYYLTATINPILYQLMSLKFRLAFKDTFGIWFPCLKPDRLPEFYSTVGHSGAFPANNNGGNGNDPTNPSNSTRLQMKRASAAGLLSRNINGSGLRHSASYRDFGRTTAVIPEDCTSSTRYDNPVRKTSGQRLSVDIDVEPTHLSLSCGHLPNLIPEVNGGDQHSSLSTKKDSDGLSSSLDTPVIIKSPPTDALTVNETVLSVPLTIKVE